MIKHVRDIGNELNPLRYSLLKNAAARQDIEGLNTVKYRIVKITFDCLYTWITVEINTSEILKTTPALTQKDIDQDSRKWRKRKPPSQKILLEQISKS
uniref:Uncharacterized protein n=1 Tax=Biomphalaria glabrata TaxID=6526 RepID=A0A2C9LZ23_BIOGL